MYMDQWQHIINNAYSALLGPYNSAIAKQEKGTVLDKVNAELLKNLIYNPATKQVFPQSPLHEKDPEKLAMNLVVGMAEPIKEKTPLTADWDTAVDIVRGAGTKGQASLDDIMKAVDTVKAEMGRQMTPEELAKNKSIDRAIDMIQPRVEAEMGGELPKQLPKELEGLAKIEKTLEKKYPSPNKIVDSRGFLTTGGKIVDDGALGQHPLMLQEAGLTGKGSLEKYIESGGIRLRNTGIGGQQNIQIGKAPTQSQIKQLASLSDQTPIHFDFRNGDRVLSSPVEGVSKQEFLNQLEKFYNSGNQSKGVQSKGGVK